MNLHDLKIALLLTGIFLSVTVSAPVLGKFIVINKESFIAMAILSGNRTTEGYYPNDNPNIPLGELVNWHIYLDNHVSMSRYLSVKVRIGDAQTMSPNTTAGTPSPALEMYEFRTMMSAEETRITPFQWSINEATNESNQLRITEISIDGHVFNTNIILSNQNNLRMIFELWIYDEESNSFIFNNKLNERNKSVWNQIWFNLGYE